MAANVKQGIHEVAGGVPLRPPATLADLAAVQHVMPAADLEALDALWPVQDDPDELDAFIAAQRGMRRSMLKDRAQRG